MPRPNRKLKGYIVLPDKIPNQIARRILIEVQDVSTLDAPAHTLASVTLLNTLLYSGARLPFSIEAPEIKASHVADLRVHIDIVGDITMSKGDFLTTAAFPVPDRGSLDNIEVSVNQI